MASKNNSFSVHEFLNSGCVLSSRNGRVWVGWGQPVIGAQRALTGLSIFAPDFFLRSIEPWLCFPFAMEMFIGDLVGLLLETPTSPRQRPNWQWIPAPFESFRDSFYDLQRQIQLGNLKKAVPVAFEKAHASPTTQDVQRILCAVLESSISTHLQPYGFWTPAEGILGASPEVLFEIGADRKLYTMALAGTRPVQCDRPPLLEDPKELKEHQIVVAGIAAQLAQWGQGPVQVGTTRELHLPTLSHLLTPMEVQLANNPEFETLARLLHPTAALGGEPREAAMRWLSDDQAAGERLRFGAPFGAVFPDGPAKCLVGIRNIQWNGAIHLGAGCGIIAESRIEREWEEIALKMRAVKGVLGI